MKKKTPQEARDEVSHARNVRRKIFDESCEEYVACHSCGMLMGPLENICPACGAFIQRRRKL